MAVLATERFLNDLRKELGDQNFDRLFAIHPTVEDLDSVSTATAQMREFHFFTPSISSGLSIGASLIHNIKHVARERWNAIKMLLFDNSNELPIDDASFRRKRHFVFKKELFFSFLN